MSDQWVDNQLKSAEKYGYVTCAFGLRVRTPRIRQTVLGTKVTPQEAEAEKRTAANALGQSWCMLCTRASVEVNTAVRDSELYRYDISPCAMIHDALYFLVRDDIDCLVWLHDHLLHAVEWQDDPMIAHPLVHLGGELSLFWPDWSEEIQIPNHADADTTLKIIHKAVKDYRLEHEEDYIPF